MGEESLKREKLDKREKERGRIKEIKRNIGKEVDVLGGGGRDKGK
jgi:hypothetical protein